MAKSRNNILTIPIPSATPWYKTWWGVAGIVALSYGAYTMLKK